VKDNHPEMVPEGVERGTLIILPDDGGF
jgi:hypothetical protein